MNMQVEPDEQTEDFLRGPESSLEDEFEEEKGRRSLASIFESDGEEVLEIDATQQDESLLVITSIAVPSKKSVEDYCR